MPLLPLKVRFLYYTMNIPAFASGAKSIYKNLQKFFYEKNRFR